MFWFSKCKGTAFFLISKIFLLFSLLVNGSRGVCIFSFGLGSPHRSGSGALVVVACVPVVVVALVLVFRLWWSLRHPVATALVARVPVFGGGRSCSGCILCYFANLGKMGSAPTHPRTHAHTYTHTRAIIFSPEIFRLCTEIFSPEIFR